MVACGAWSHVLVGLDWCGWMEMFRVAVNEMPSLKTGYMDGNEIRSGGYYDEGDLLTGVSDMPESGSVASSWTHGLG